MIFILYLLQAYSLVIFVYAILSWFDPYRNWQVSRFLRVLAEPVLTPVRQAVPPVGGLDLSTIIVLVVLQVLIKVLGG
jgi:YggT family protein